MSSLSKTLLSAGIFLSLGILSGNIARADGQQFTAKEGSLLARYDADVKAMKELKEESDIRKAAVAILKTYFGFTAVEFDANLFTNEETQAARWIAANLRNYLPAQSFARSTPGTGQYIRPDTGSVNSFSREAMGYEDRRHNDYIIRFDDDLEGTRFSAEYVDPEALPKKVRYRLTVGVKSHYIEELSLKPFFSLMLNYHSPYYTVNFDLPPY